MSNRFDETEMLEVLRVPQLYDWQVKALSNPPKDGRRLYTAETGCGKSIIFYREVLRHALDRQHDSFVVVPYHALADEIARRFTELSNAYPNFKVVTLNKNNPRAANKKKPSEDLAIDDGEGGTSEDSADQDGNLIHAPRRVYVVTMEGATVLLNALALNGSINSLSRLGLVVADEFHFIGDANRGGVLESFFLRLKHLCPRAEVIGMTATVSNQADLHKFLACDSFDAGVKRAPADEFYFYKQCLYKKDGEEWKQTESLLNKDLKVELLNRLHKSCDRGRQQLVFCVSKASCLALAKAAISERRFFKLSTLEQEASFKILNEPDHPELYDVFTSFLERNKKAMVADSDGLMFRRLSLMGHLRVASPSMDSDLLRGILVGVACHTADYTGAERAIIERGFMEGIITTIFCTTTLAAGVNLPADDVFIYAFTHQSRDYSSMQLSSYIQMIGRGGRPRSSSSSSSSNTGRKQQKGASYMFVADDQQSFFLRMRGKGFEPCKSSLASVATGPRGEIAVVSSAPLQHLFLQLAVVGTCHYIEEFRVFIAGSLFAIQHDEASLKLATLDALEQLASHQLVSINPETNLVTATRLGERACRAGVNELALVHEQIQSLERLASMAAKTGDALLTIGLLAQCVPQRFMERPFPRSSMSATLERMRNDRPAGAISPAQEAILPEKVVCKLAQMLGSGLDLSGTYKLKCPRKRDDEYHALRLCYAAVLGDIVAADGRIGAKPSKTPANCESWCAFDRGSMIELLDMVEAEAAILARICQSHAGLTDCAPLLTLLSKRIRYRCAGDLVPLMEINSRLFEHEPRVMTVEMARGFMNDGVRTPADVVASVHLYAAAGGSRGTKRDCNGIAFSSIHAHRLKICAEQLIQSGAPKGVLEELEDEME